MEKKHSEERDAAASREAQLQERVEQLEKLVTELKSSSESSSTNNDSTIQAAEVTAQIEAAEVRILGSVKDQTTTISADIAQLKSGDAKHSSQVSETQQHVEDLKVQLKDQETKLNGTLQPVIEDVMRLSTELSSLRGSMSHSQRPSYAKPTQSKSHERRPSQSSVASTSSRISTASNASRRSRSMGKRSTPRTRARHATGDQKEKPHHKPNPHAAASSNRLFMMSPQKHTESILVSKFTPDFAGHIAKFSVNGWRWRMSLKPKNEGFGVFVRPEKWSDDQDIASRVKVLQTDIKFCVYNKWGGTKTLLSEHDFDNVNFSTDALKGVGKSNVFSNDDVHPASDIEVILDLHFVPQRRAAPHSARSKTPMRM
jgi:hypothetical protein